MVVLQNKTRKSGLNFNTLYDTFFYQNGYFTLWHYISGWKQAAGQVLENYGAGQLGRTQNHDSECPHLRASDLSLLIPTSFVARTSTMKMEYFFV